MKKTDFIIESGEVISKMFLDRNIHSFSDACRYVKNLPYKRNSDKIDLKLVFEEQGGTCSTKNALLKKLAIENGQDDIRLMMGIYRMNATNTPPVGQILQSHNLTWIPEAHMYLRIKDAILDCTSAEGDQLSFETDLIAEMEIDISQIDFFKVEVHKQYMRQWLEMESDANFTLEEAWNIREQCIYELAKVWLGNNTGF